MNTKAQDLFTRALELPEPERDAFLAKACGDDADLHLDVQRMLVDAARADSFFGDADGATLGAEEFKDTYAEKEGDVIGPYKLRQQIGEGGFGTVWMAEQSVPISRMVALKVIKAGMDTKQVLARFEAERQAVAMMDHPHIAKVLDAGATPTGRPYFAMELVKGIPITDYCDQAGLGTKERLALFRDVCSAINHAHQKGIIHRDIKPSNVMVTLHGDKPVVKVIDFGIAKATQGKLTDQTLFTRFEQFIGTPVYMSPEQASLSGLDIDTRSDIYALGILLYELLVGKPPFDAKSLVSAGYEEMRRIIREVEPAKPSSRLSAIIGEERTLLARAHRIEEGKLSRLVEPDLDWIVMKAIEKDRTRRYETANAFAQDIVRYLSEEPVSARPPSAGYQFRKFARRNKAALRVSAFIAAVLVAATVVSTWLAVRATRAEKKAISSFNELRATAPAFAEQARGLVERGKFADAITKLDYAIKLRPDAAEFLVAKGDLFQCQLQIAAAAVLYRDALRVEPGLARAEISAKLCEELLAAKPAADGKLSSDSLAKLHLAMQQQQRPAAELLPIARLLGEEKKHLLDFWLTRLRDLPVSAENPLSERLTVRDDGRLALDLSGTKITDLSPLAEAPLATLSIAKTTELTDLTPLREMHSLEELNLNESRISDLAPLRALRPKRLHLNGSPVVDLTPIQGMPLEEISLSKTRVTDLSPLIGMPLKAIALEFSAVQDFTPLARMPLEMCYLSVSKISDLTVLRGMPLKELSLFGCVEARNYAVLSEIKTLESLLLPHSYRTLPFLDYMAIGALRNHPKLHQIQSDVTENLTSTSIQSKERFWQNWDIEQTFVPALRKVGIKFQVSKQPDGAYSLYIEDQPLSDLSILKGAPIRALNLNRCKVTDLTPLSDLPLNTLQLHGNPITDISPLQGMKLQVLSLANTAVSDLSPLAGMPLKSLELRLCKNITTVAQLLEIPTLENLNVPVTVRDLEVLRNMPNLKMLDFSYIEGDYHTVGSTAVDFWKRWDSLTWLHALNASGVSFSANIFGEKTSENSDFTKLWYSDFTKLWSVTITSTAFSDCSIFKGAKNIGMLSLSGSTVKDLEPLRGMSFQRLALAQTPVTDLAPLRGAKISSLDLSKTRIADLEPLRGMGLITLRLHGCTQLTDLSPLADCKALQSLTLPPNAKNIEILRALPRLERISFNEDRKPPQPAQTAAEFWKEYGSQGWLKALSASGLTTRSMKQLEDGTWDLDLTGARISDLKMLSGAPISILKVGNTAITDLAPLRGMALKDFRCFNTKVADLSPLQGMPLEYLQVSGTPVTDLTPLRGMGLITLALHGCTQLTDLTPLAEAKTLTILTLPPKAKDIEFLRTFSKLERLGTQDAKTGGGLPGQPVAEFWKQYDAKK